MCQGQQTYGGRRNEVVSAIQPGHVSTVMEGIYIEPGLALHFVLFWLDACVHVCVCITLVHGQRETNY